MRHWKKVKDKRFLGIGVGVHGLVDHKKGISLYAPHFKWKNVKVKENLEEEFALPVWVDNDVRVMALGEKWAGDGEKFKNFIFINAGYGIGSAIIINNQLYYGLNMTAGEFGHMSIVEDGPKCSCGNHGCIEALASVGRIIKRYKPEFKNFNDYDKTSLIWDDFVKSAINGKKQTKDILIESANYLGSGVANLVNLFNPEAVIIGGELMKVEKIVMPEIIKQVKTKSLDVPGESVKIAAATHSEKYGVIGAASKVMQEYFNIEKDGR